MGFQIVTDHLIWHISVEAIDSGKDSLRVHSEDSSGSWKAMCYNRVWQTTRTRTGTRLMTWHVNGDINRGGTIRCRLLLYRAQWSVL